MMNLLTDPLAHELMQRALLAGIAIAAVQVRDHYTRAPDEECR